MVEILPKPMTLLVEPDIKYLESYLAALREYHAEGFLTDKISYESVASDFDGYIRKIIAKRTGKFLPLGYVPESEYWLVDGVEYVGTLKIRHSLNEALERVGGHIGFYIRPSKRGQGYGNEILTLALPRAKELGIRRVLITCDETNGASRKIIESHGGVLENIVPNGGGQPRRMRYWINL